MEDGTRGLTCPCSERLDPASATSGPVPEGAAMQRVVPSGGSKGEAEGRALGAGLVPAADASYLSSLRGPPGSAPWWGIPATVPSKSLLAVNPSSMCHTVMDHSK
ncbi:hypothetical protein CYMTET_44789 [Cymbomonas tetramitiformis]|uniref:Uncharacterized protein n=1 Tax=Cymbomonas tetramitiformis TaxID=36881 RepID=A0AAE0BZI0_9CHLO|nr:hypothetical protein CYMTET_44789 [Cymbomonas tetramitiformis]